MPPKQFCFDALQWIHRKTMFKRHIHIEQRRDSPACTRVPWEVTTMSQFSGKHVRIPDITPVIQYTDNYCFDYCCGKSELCAFILYIVGEYSSSI